jgi:HEXXH motif-containing protein
VLRELAEAQYSKHLVLVRTVLASAEQGSREQARRARQARALLTAARAEDQAAFQSVIAHPAVGAWALHTVRASRGGPAAPGAGPGGLSAVAAAAAIRAGLRADIEVTTEAGTLMLPSLGALRTPASSAIVRATRRGAEIITGESRIRLPIGAGAGAGAGAGVGVGVGPAEWLALRRISVGSVSFLVDDVDPFRMPAVPDVTARLEASELDDWSQTFRETWSLLLHEHPAVAKAVAQAIRVIVPLARPPSGERSSSSPETAGAIALSRPLSASSLAVTLVHELQHLKLNALINLVTLTQRDDGRRYYAPWRDDPRPVSGLLHGAYAYLGISGFWRRQRYLVPAEGRLRAHAEFARWRAASALATSTLAGSGQLTTAGSRFVRRMAATLQGWRYETVPADAELLAGREADEHRARWTQAHGAIPTWPPG